MPDRTDAVAEAPDGSTLPRGLAATSMVLGLVGLVLLLWIGAWPPSVLALILGIVALRRVNAGRAGGRRWAITGIVTGGIAVGFMFFTLAVLVPLINRTS